MSGRKPTFYLLQLAAVTVQMAFDVEQIRSTALRVAASHGLEVVDLEFHGGSKHRILRVFIEKSAEERHKQVQQDPAEPGADRLAGITHTDCEVFSRDFGTILDVEDLIPGAEYTLEVSSPGLDRRLHGVEDFRRFSGMLAKVQTFEPVGGNRHWQGTLTDVNERSIRLNLGAGRRKKSPTKASGGRAPGAESDAINVEIALNNIEKAQLVPEF